MCVCVYKKAQQLVSPRGKLVPPRELSDSVVGNFSYNAKPPLSENNCFEIVFLQWLIVLDLENNRERWRRDSFEL